MLFLQTFFSDNNNWLIRLDKYLFLKINRSFTSNTLDKIYPWYRESTTWVPLYLFVIVLLFINFGKKTWNWLLFVGFTIAMSDQISSTVFKHSFARLRPCADETMQFQMRLLLNHCSGGFSFTSSHATNHFALAMFITQTLQPVFGKYNWLWFAWAASISYGQIYVGVHYPLDVVCGALIGCGIGYLVASVFKRRIGTSFELQ